MEIEQNLLSDQGGPAYTQEELVKSRELIRELQESIFSLRMSRRLLMSWLEQVQATQQQEIERLTRATPHKSRC